MPEPMKVDERSQWLIDDDKKHELARALREGPEAMRKAALKGKWMKPNPGELEVVDIGQATNITYSGSTDFTVYDLRVERSTCPPTWRETIDEAAHLPFRTRITYEGWDEEITDTWVDDIDGEGQGFEQWAAGAFEDSHYEGVVFALLDNDPRIFPDSESRRIAGARPYVTLLHRSDMIKIIFHNKRLVYISFNQPIPVVAINPETPGAVIDESTPAIKVLIAGDPNAQRGSVERKIQAYLFVENEKGEYVEDVSQRGTIEPENPRDELVDLEDIFIPMYGGKRKSPYRADSPYLDTAWMAAQVWCHDSELAEAEREMSLKWIHESGVPADEIDEHGAQPVRPDTRGCRYHVSSEPSATMKLIESDGKSSEEIRKWIEWRLEMIKQAHRRIDSTTPRGPVTATEITLEGVVASSELEMRLIMHEAAWYKILSGLALLGGLQKRGTVGIPHDFGLPQFGAEACKELYLANKMHPANYYAGAKAWGIVDDEWFDLELELARHKQEQEAERLALNPAVENRTGEEDV